MRIHTNLIKNDIESLTHKSGAPIYFNHLETHASRTHARSFEVRLGGSSNSRTNAGNRGAGDETAATWDEWGAFFGALFDADPTARCGGTAKRPLYADADHFHYETSDRFMGKGDWTWPHVTHMPADTHKRHTWERGGDWLSCKKCSAERPGWAASATYRAAHQIGA